MKKSIVNTVIRQVLILLFSFMIMAINAQVKINIWQQSGQVLLFDLDQSRLTFLADGNLKITDGVRDQTFDYSRLWKLTFTSNNKPLFGQKLMCVSYKNGLQEHYTLNKVDSIEFKKKEGVVDIPTFDYLVIRYIWTDADGTDLDSATEFENTGLIDPTGVSIDRTAIGFAMQGNSLSSLTDYIGWAGDNVTSGQECVLLNVKNLVSEVNYPKLPRLINILTYATWYSVMRNGNVTMEVSAYRGGIMTKSGYNYVNIGGEQVYKQNLSTKVTTIRGSSTYRTSYTLTSKIVLDKQTFTAVIHLQ